MDIYNRLLGCLVGIALGDALGMPTEFMTPGAIQEKYGEVRELRAPHLNHIHKLHRGQVTDDTEQILALLDAYFKHGKMSVHVAVEGLITWAEEKDVFNSTYLGPSSKRALEGLLAGCDPHTTGFMGKTIGAAMRVPAVALVHHGSDVESVVKQAADVSLPTHGTNLAISGATSMAVALRAAFNGSNIHSVIEAAKYGAEKGLAYGYPYPSASVAKRISWAVDLTSDLSDPWDAADILYDIIGVDMVPHEIIPVVMALFALETSDPMESLFIAVNMGGDTDTIGALLGALLGAFYGVDIFPEDMWREVDQLNQLELEKYAKRLCVGHSTNTGEEGER